MGKGMSKSYYFEPIKIVRDLVHEYINLTRFDLEVIDTISFQRLKDIRQLTCQHVYPAAHHTRFEHSLGALELTRQAIKHLNRNGIIGNKPKDYSEPIITENLEFNATLAALLHDVGHCPFSHMGETEFDSEEVRKYLYDTIKNHPCLEQCKDLLKKINTKSSKSIGAVHEQLSCIVILKSYSDILTNLTKRASDDTDICYIETDFELIIRSILGIEYDVSSYRLFEENKVKNVIVRLINSSIFDMDKLDYIMRDSILTGIGTPIIDTKRLFRNMYFSNNLSLVFTSKAVPALQNMIDSRDGLYMYVYNHHAVVFSDFIYTYISRRLSHNTDAFIAIAYPEMSDSAYKTAIDFIEIYSLGLIPKPYLFSIEAIVEQNRSDSDWISLLNIIHNIKIDSQELMLGIRGELREIWNEDFACFEDELTESMEAESELSEDDIDEIVDEEPEFSEADIKLLSIKIQNVFELIHQFKTRHFLKPWWKTVFEFTNFMNQYFRDDITRKQVGKFICDGGIYGLEAAEFRSQIAKHVIYITNKLAEKRQSDLIEPLSDGDFFVIQRSTRFFSPDTIEKLEIALKSSEIIGPPIDVNYSQLDSKQEYYIKTLTNIIPQKDYSSIYAKEGFYIFSKPISDEQEPDEQIKKKHYKLLEQIFAFVSNRFIQEGEQVFIKSFQPQNLIENKAKTKLELKNIREQAELKSLESKGELFLYQFFNKE